MTLRAVDRAVSPDGVDDVERPEGAREDPRLGNGAPRRRRRGLPIPLGTATVRTLWLYGVMAAVRALGLVLMAEALASGIGLLAYADAVFHPGTAGLFSEPKAVPLLGASWAIHAEHLQQISARGLAASDFMPVVVVALAGAVLQAGAQWAGLVLARRAALGTKETVRAQVLRRVLATGGQDTAEGLGGTTVLLTRDLDDLDPYYTQTLTSLVASAVIPLLVGLRILAADPWSALVVVLTVPLIPVFMALIGAYTRDSTAAAQTALHRLSHHLVELAEGLPVLVGLGRSGHVREQIRQLSRQDQERSMATLRIAFLSSLALDLISTLSVAVVAVTVGVRLIGGSLELDAGLIALILAPECYLPLRNLGMAFHASTNGMEAVERINRITDQPTPQPLTGVGQKTVASGVAIEGLTVRYPGQYVSAVNSLDCALPAGEITAISGPSGSGKTTVLNVLNGRLGHGTTLTGVDGSVEVTGTVTGVDPERVVWVPQAPRLVRQTVLGELLTYGAANEVDAQRCLNECAAGGLADRHPAELSSGEVRRVALARAIARLGALERGRDSRADGGLGAATAAPVVLLDEPTAHVDAHTAHRVRDVLLHLKRSHPRAVVVVVTHDPQTAALADHRVALDRGRKVAATSRTDTGAVPAIAADQRTGEEPPELAEASHSTEPAGSSDIRPTLRRRDTLRMLALVLQPGRPRWWAAVALGILSAGFAVALTALSGWLIVEASARPPILLLLVAIVGVRFFGIGRSVLRYLERLTTHRAVFDATTALRLRLWDKLSVLAVTVARLRRSGDAVQRLVSDVDEARDLAPRVVAPAIVGAVISLAGLGVVLWLLPGAWWIQLIVVVVAVVLAPAATLFADAHSSTAETRLRTRLLRVVSAALAAAPDLRVNRADHTVRAAIAHEDSQATAKAQRSAWAQGLGEAMTTATGILAGAGALLVAVPEVSAGRVPAATVAAVSLMNIALILPALDIVTALRRWPELKAVLGRMGGTLLTPAGSGASVAVADAAQTATDDDARADDTDAAGEGEVGAGSVPRVSVTVADISARWPTSDSPVFDHVSARVSTGEWLSVIGPSGSGKSTLLAVLMGFLEPQSGSVEWAGAGQWRGSAGQPLVAWCPQDAHLFDSTLRANLVLARPADQTQDQEELEEVLDSVGLGRWYRGLPQGLDTRVGSDGAFVSGGQKQRIAVARALLTRSPLLLLDEPTAHLDSATATALIRDVRAGSRERAVVMVTHRAADVATTDRVLSLGALAARP